jgi:thymidine kinase
MFSGKSEELIRRLRRAKIAQQSVIIFKPQIDNRYGLEFVVSHDGSKLDAKPLSNVHDILTITQEYNATVIGLDETQFFAPEIVNVICQLIQSGKRVIVAGLDRDFRGAPFGCMPSLLALADKVTKLQAICTQCGHDAHFSQRLIDGNPAKFDDPIIMLGAQEAYQARCRGCYSIDKGFQI